MKKKTDLVVEPSAEQCTGLDMGVRFYSGEKMVASRPY
jgi:hypothetical protein